MNVFPKNTSVHNLRRSTEETPKKGNVKITIEYYGSHYDIEIEETI